jgi:hypothetical protein
LTCNDDPGVEVTDVTIGLGETITCTFVNDDDAPSLTLKKVVVNGSNPGGTAVESDFTLVATGPTGFFGAGPTVNNGASFDAGTYDLSETGPSGYLASDWVCVGNGSQSDADTIVLGLGDSATCTITNTAMGMVTVTKLTNGAIDPTKSITFDLFEGPNDTTGSGFLSGDPIASDNTFGDNDELDFDGFKLVPGDDYTVCENPVPAGWTSFWWIDANGDGVFQNEETMVTPYDPHSYDEPSEDMGVRCYDFSVGVGETLDLGVDNTFPGGDPRTIGYWKNWNECTNGNQAQTAYDNGGAEEGFFLLDHLLPQTLGTWTVETCEEAQSILDKSSIDDKKRANDAAYELASQLLAAQLNLATGAETCDAVQDAVLAGNDLLEAKNFDGTGSYWKPKDKDADRDLALELAATLDTYNNGDLCTS